MGTLHLSLFNPSSSILMCPMGIVNINVVLSPDRHDFQPFILMESYLYVNTLFRKKPYYINIVLYISCCKSLNGIYLIVVRCVDTVSSALISICVDFSHDFLAK